ncbi:MAG: cyclic pyranopterin monophosphate synthase MoaC [PVC group bacterium]
MSQNQGIPARPSHWSEDGNLRMIDVSGKTLTPRTAEAAGKILIKEETIALIRSGKTPKGDIFTVSKIAGIQAAKQTPFLIPMCHSLNITHCDIRFRMEANAISVTTTVKTENRTGVEMEALVGTAAALLTIYDMLKPVDKTMVITDIELLKKSGGKSGDWKK